MRGLSSLPMKKPRQAQLVTRASKDSRHQLQRAGGWHAPLRRASNRDDSARTVGFQYEFCPGRPGRLTAFVWGSAKNSDPTCRSAANRGGIQGGYEGVEPLPCGDPFGGQGGEQVRHRLGGGSRSAQGFAAHRHHVKGVRPGQDEQDAADGRRGRCRAYAQGGAGDSAAQPGQGVLGCDIGPPADGPQGAGLRRASHTGHRTGASPAITHQLVRC